MFRALLAEGKEPPRIEDMGESVRVTFTASDLAAPFRNFVQEESDAGRGLGVDQLLVIQYLLRHPEIDTATASRICQRSELEAREVLSMLERQYEYLERGGAGRSTFWMLRSELHRKLAAPGTFERDLRLDIEAAKTRILSVLNRRADLHEAGLSNTELRKLTLLDRHRVKRVMDELRKEGLVRADGAKRGARWVLVEVPEQD
jgi:ATP-dependent DNA helicase RecG